MENIFQELLSLYPTFSVTNQKVSDYIMNNKEEIPFISITQLASQCGVSDASITRFCKKIGFDKFNIFKLEVAKQLSSMPSQDTTTTLDNIKICDDDDFTKIIYKIMSLEIQTINQTASDLNPLLLEKAYQLIKSSKRVFFFGLGSNGIIATEAWSKFATISSKFYTVSDSHMQAITTSLFTKDDVLVYFSYSGSTIELAQISKLVHKQGAKLILITHYKNSRIASFADVTLTYTSKESTMQSGSISLRIAQLYLIDVLYHRYYQDHLEISKENMSKTSLSFLPFILD